MTCVSMIGRWGVRKAINIAWLLLASSAACGCAQLPNWNGVDLRMNAWDADGGPLKSAPLRIANVPIGSRGFSFAEGTSEALEGFMLWPEGEQIGNGALSYTDADGVLETHVPPMESPQPVPGGIGLPGRAFLLQIVKPVSPVYCAIVWDDPAVPTKVVKWTPTASERTAVAVEESECQLRVWTQGKPTAPQGDVPHLRKPNELTTVVDILLRPVWDLSFSKLKEESFYWEFPAFGEPKLIDVGPSTLVGSAHLETPPQFRLQRTDVTDDSRFWGGYRPNATYELRRDLFLIAMPKAPPEMVQYHLSPPATQTQLQRRYLTSPPSVELYRAAPERWPDVVGVISSGSLVRVRQVQLWSASAESEESGHVVVVAEFQGNEYQGARVNLQDVSERGSPGSGNLYPDKDLLVELEE